MLILGLLSRDHDLSQSQDYGLISQELTKEVRREPLQMNKFSHQIYKKKRECLNTREVCLCNNLNKHLRTTKFLEKIKKSTNNLEIMGLHNITPQLSFTNKQTKKNSHGFTKLPYIKDGVCVF